MSDDTTTFSEIKAATAQFAREREWEQFHAPKNLAMAIAAEAGELLEPYLWLSTEESKKLTEDLVKKQRVSEEVADVVILCAQFANMTGIDLAAAIQAKLKKNAENYPVAKAKGRSGKYDELV